MLYFVRNGWLSQCLAVSYRFTCMYWYHLPIKRDVAFDRMGISAHVEAQRMTLLMADTNAPEASPEM